MATQLNILNFSLSKVQTTGRMHAELHTYIISHLLRGTANITKEAVEGR